MLRRKKLPPKAILSVQDNRRLADVLMLLITIDKRVEVQRSKAKRVRKSPEHITGSLKCGPIFLRMKVCLTISNTCYRIKILIFSLHC